MSDVELLRIIKKTALSFGACKAEIIPADSIRTDNNFRKLCEVNSCGNYGSNYMCPPNVEPIDELIQRLRSYEWALVYQTVSALEDSYDFPGMMEAGKHHNSMAQKLRDKAESIGLKALHLGAGSCWFCENCAIKIGKPCRYPERTMSSLEVYGVDVTALAAAAGMQYINGTNTVTYFGAVLI